MISPLQFPPSRVYKPVSYLPDSSAVERILPSEVSVPFSYYYTLYYTYFLSYSIWSWSLNPSLIPATLLKYIHMKFSSISLITAGLAAIAGSTIAAPGPLHARALIVDDLFKRQNDWQKKHLVVAATLHQSSSENWRASEAAKTTSDSGETYGIKTPEEWGQLSDRHLKVFKEHTIKCMEHLNAAEQLDKGPKYNDLHKDYRAAILGRKSGVHGRVLAEADRRLPNRPA